jgi:hypothetical protein
MKLYRLEAIVVAAIVRQNNFNFSVGMQAATYNRLWNRELLLAAVVPTTAFISVWVGQ